MRKGILIHYPASTHTEAVPPAYSSRISADHIDVRLICRASYHLANSYLPLCGQICKLSGKPFALPLATYVSLTL